MKVLLTGASGFLGNIITRHLKDFDIIRLGRGIDLEISCDLSNKVPELSIADIVIHAAGKAHVVPKTGEDKQAFFDVNLVGTQNLLKGLEKMGTLPRSFVFISSVAVYGIEQGVNVTEDSALKAKDPYGESKIQAERLIQEWCYRHSIICSILRLPLLAGVNPPGNLGAMIKGIKGGYYFNIDGGKAKKSMVLAEDVASIIPKVVEVGGVFNLTDGDHPSFFDLSVRIACQLKTSKPYAMPLWIANSFAYVGDVLGPKFPLNSNKLKKMVSDLTFDDTKARNVLGWNPRHVLDGFYIV